MFLCLHAILQKIAAKLIRIKLYRVFADGILIWDKEVEIERSL